MWGKPGAPTSSLLAGFEVSDRVLAYNNIGALIMRKGFRGILYYNYNYDKEPPKIVEVTT